jgi:RHS repeat-associated protein
MGTYTEQYRYDAVGNFQQYIHIGSDPANPGWTRTYTYSEASLLEPFRVSNRLTRTTVSGAQPYIEDYGHDVHGNMIRMPQLHCMQWDFKDQLNVTQRQAVNADDADGTLHQGERTYYVYDSSGQRARKVTQRQNGTLMKERLYLGGYEVYREYDASGNTVTLERESLHVMDDKQRVALVETRTQGSDGTAMQLIRYQFGNHLGSASLELDDLAQIISYEEYFPYGSTSYQAGRSAAEVRLKRYRYTGMERDEESGLEYHTARYYAPWCARWISADPSGLAGGLNLYSYAANSPIVFLDTTGNKPLTFQIPPGTLDPRTGKLLPRNQSLALPGRPRKASSGSGGHKTGSPGGNAAGVVGGEDKGVAGGDVGGHTGTRPQHGMGDDPGPHTTDSGPGDPGTNRKEGGGGGKAAGGEAGGKRQSGDPGGRTGGTETSGQPGGKPGQTGGGVDLAATGSGSGHNDGWDWLPEVLEYVLIAIVAIVAIATVFTFVAAFSAALASGFSLSAATTLATGEVITGVGVVGAGAKAVDELEEDSEPSLFFHYTDADESSFAKGLRPQSSVTDKLYSDPFEASQELGIPIPDKVIPIQNNGQFVPNSPPIVQPSFRYQGGGTDFTNPKWVPAGHLLPARPIGSK